MWYVVTAIVAFLAGGVSAIGLMLWLAEDRLMQPKPR